jgi:hypothetical protein
MMSAFDDLNAAAQDFSEGVMGETFSYTSPAGSTTTGLTGVFNQPVAVFSFEDFSQKAVVDLVCVTGKEQWGAVVPANRGTISYNSITYTVDAIDGISSAGEPCFTINLKVLK